MWYEDYENLIPPAHRYPKSAPYASAFDPENDGVERSRFAQFVMLCCQQGIDLGNMIEAYLVDFDLDNAVGTQLEFLAALMGVERKIPVSIEGSDGTLTDDDLRLLIRARIAINTWDGTNAGIADVLRDVFGQYNVSFVDMPELNGEEQTSEPNGSVMTMRYIIRGKFTPIQTDMVKGDLIFPRPSGVHVFFTFMDTADDTSIATDSAMGSDFQRAGMDPLIPDT